MFQPCPTDRRARLQGTGLGGLADVRQELFQRTLGPARPPLRNRRQHPPRFMAPAEVPEIARPRCVFVIQHRVEDAPGISAVRTAALHELD